MAVFKPKTDGGARFSFLGAKGSASAYLDRVEALAEEGLALSREWGDERGIAGSLAALALAARSRGRYDESRRAYECSSAYRVAAARVRTSSLR